MNGRDDLYEIRTRAALLENCVKERLKRSTAEPGGKGVVSMYEPLAREIIEFLGKVRTLP